MRIGFIGCGRMAGAILNGCLQKGFIMPDNVFVYERDPERLSYIVNNWGVNETANTDELLESAHIVILGVKPQALPAILLNIGAKAARKHILLVSIAAGKAINELEKMIGEKAPVMRVMPNLNAQIYEGVAAINANSMVTENDKKYVIDMFRTVGAVYELPEELFPVFTAIAGCSPAFTFMYIDALARAAVRLGMNKRQALEITAAAAAGSVKNLIQSNMHAWDLIDQVCSPGGTTIEGISTLQAGRFEAVISEAVQACVEKDKKLGVQ